MKEIREHGCKLPPTWVLVRYPSLLTHTPTLIFHLQRRHGVDLIELANSCDGNTGSIEVCVLLKQSPVLTLEYEGQGIVWWDFHGVV